LLPCLKQKKDPCPMALDESNVAKASSNTLKRRSRLSVQRFALDDSDSGDSRESSNSTEDGCLEQFPLHIDGDSGDENDAALWTRIVELMELEDEYRFDPESVADMIEEGADVQELADQLCETMIRLGATCFRGCRFDYHKLPCPRLSSAPY